MSYCHYTLTWCMPICTVVVKTEMFKTKTKTKTQIFKTETKTKTLKNESRDVSRPRLKSREPQLCLFVVWYSVQFN